MTPSYEKATRSSDASVTSTVARNDTPDRSTHHARVVTPEWSAFHPSPKGRDRVSSLSLEDIFRESPLDMGSLEIPSLSHFSGVASPVSEDAVDAAAISAAKASSANRILNTFCEEDVMADSPLTTPYPDDLLNNIDLTVPDSQQTDVIGDDSTIINPEALPLTTVMSAEPSDQEFYGILENTLPPLIKKESGGNTATDHERACQDVFDTLLYISTALKKTNKSESEAQKAWSELPFADLNVPVEELIKKFLDEEGDPNPLPPETKGHEGSKQPIGTYRDEDVLLGRGGETNRHLGNKLFHEEIRAIFPVYAQLKDGDKKLKTRMRNFIRDYNHSKGRRFMKDALADKEQANHSGKKQGFKKGKRLRRWVEASDAETLRKCIQAFRDEKPKSKKQKASFPEPEQKPSKSPR